MLPVRTVLGGDKRLFEVSGISADGVEFRGYEMHVGNTEGEVSPMLRMADGSADGAVSRDGRVGGCYVHGLFAHDAQRSAWLRRLGAAPSGRNHAAATDGVLDDLARHLESHIDVDALIALAR
jgi:adenosylcobyric acid synthase